jgi:hypothetical protein
LKLFDAQQAKTAHPFMNTKGKLDKKFVLLWRVCSDDENIIPRGNILIRVIHENINALLTYCYVSR